MEKGDRAKQMCATIKRLAKEEKYEELDVLLDSHEAMINLDVEVDWQGELNDLFCKQERDGKKYFAVACDEVIYVFAEKN